MLLSVSLYQLVSIILVLIAFFLGFKILESSWSYKINKPFLWEEAVKDGRLSDALKKAERTYDDKVRFYNFWFQIERIKKDNIPGAFAELGVYKGETASFIHLMEPSRNLHLFDTFNGFDSGDLAAEVINNSKYSATNFSDTSIESVKKIFENSNQVHFYPGYFPDTTASLTETTFALVHLDADLYQPTLAALQYFYPKLSPGGVIVVHDYNHSWAGVTKAVDQFRSAIPEQIIGIPDTQGSIMIIKNKC